MKKIIILLICLTGILARLIIIKESSVPFPQDMGRDLLWTKDIIFYGRFTLIGPAASIWGVYFAPLWYYFLALPLLFFKGNPLSATFTTLLSLIMIPPLSYFFFKNYLKGFHLVSLVILLCFSAIFINLSTFAFHANLLPILTFMTVYFCFLSITKKSIFFVGAALFTSLMFSADPAPAIVFTISIIIFYLLFKLFKKNFKMTFISSCLAFVLPILPLVLFEIRNNFVQTKSLAAYFLGNNPSLSGQLPIVQRIPARLLTFLSFFKESFMPNEIFLTITLIIFIIIGVFLFFKKNKDYYLKKLLDVNLYFLVTTLLIFTFLITVEVKNWYLYGIAIPITFLIVFALKGFDNKYISLILILSICFFNLKNTVSEPRFTNSKNDPASLNNQIKAINFVYKDASGIPFAIYIFTPSVYDYNYQYLIWWNGIKEAKGLPAEFAYLPQKPAYVRNKNLYVKVEKKSKIIYLIIEHANANEFYTEASWRNSFLDTNLIWSYKINKALTVEKRILD